jgi:ATP-binding cassette subfamily B protein
VSFEGVAWPEARVGEALASLARAAGIRLKSVPLPVGASGVERCAAWLGVDAEPTSSSFADLELMLRRMAPALVRTDEGIVAVLRTGPRSAVLVAPDGALEKRPLDALRQALVPKEVACGAVEVDEMLVGVAPERRARARAALLRGRFALARVSGIWILRNAIFAPYLDQLRGAGVVTQLATLAGLQVAQVALFTASWWVIGASALSGNLDLGWLVAWALLLVTIVPLRAAAARAEGNASIGAGILLKRRLLAGALALEPDATRADGAGSMLARVLESEVVEQLALDAGGAALFTTIDLTSAAIVLALGASPAVELVVLSLFIVAAIIAGGALLRRRAAWTDARLGLTHDMIERLVGHRTRVAQQARDAWHHDEDEGVSRTLEASIRLDRASVALAVLPRAWLAASIAALSYALVAGPRSSAGIAITIGGALVAFRAFRRGARGMNALVGLAATWKRVKPLFDAAARCEAVAPNIVAERDHDSSEPLIEARGLAFGYARRQSQVLDDVSFCVDRRDQLLLLGQSGGGKSTLGAIVAGLRQPTSGLLLLDGLDLRTLGSVGWRRRVASAPQFHENHVLGATFAFNLLMGRAWPPADADLLEAEAICRELDLGGLLERMPAGLMQTVGETGWQLSHGERSRLFLARALLQGADLVILDESFAALDPATLAKAVACARRRAKALIVIAHP